jgi:phospholipase C
MWDAHIKPVDDVVSDIQSQGLDPVTWITPRFEQSEHPEWNLCYGENWTTRIVDAIMNSPEWSSTAIFITWDDWGGLYDHVPPIKVDAFGYGFRVPLLVISPYAKQGYVDHQQGEFSSVLRFIEDNWGLRPFLTARDRRAKNLSYDFDFSQPPRPPDPLPQRKCQGSQWATPASWRGIVWTPPGLVPSPAASPSPG